MWDDGTLGIPCFRFVNGNLPGALRIPKLDTGHGTGSCCSGNSTASRAAEARATASLGALRVDLLGNYPEWIEIL